MQREKAQNLVLAKIQTEVDIIRAHTNTLVQKKIYLSDKEMVGLRAIKTIRGDFEIPIPQPAGGNGGMWLAFVDDEPEANWEHLCRYLFINESGHISEVRTTAPPSLKNPFTFEEIK